MPEIVSLGRVCISTPLGPITRRRVAAFERRIRDELTKWAFFHADSGVETADYFGRRIRYRGIGFSGSPRDAFWSSEYLPAILWNGVADVLKETAGECDARGLEQPKAFVDEACWYLELVAVNMFERMAELDAQLMCGFFASPSDRQAFVRRDVSSARDGVWRTLQDHAKAACLRGPKRSEATITPSGGPRYSITFHEENRRRPRVDIVRQVGGQVVDSTTIHGESLVRLFRVVQQISAKAEFEGRLVPWQSVLEGWMESRDWKGRIFKDTTLKDYGRRIRVRLRQANLDAVWEQNPTQGARVRVNAG